MTQAPNTLDAYDEAPAVHAVDGEIVISGPHAEAAYTVSAARELARRIKAAVEALEPTSSRPPAPPA